MKFYIAAFIGEKQRVQDIYARLRELRHSIAVDWTDELGISGSDRDKFSEKVCEVAERDMNGVKDCDVFILLSDPANGRAKYAELGGAIMSNILRGKPHIYVLGEEKHHSVFFYHSAVKRVRFLEEVLSDIQQK